MVKTVIQIKNVFVEKIQIKNVFVEKVVAQPADVASLGRICFLAELGVRQTMLRNAIQIKNVFVEKGGCTVCGCCVIGSDLFGGIGRTPDHGEECNSNQKCDRGEGQGVDFVRIRKIRAKYPFF